MKLWKRIAIGALSTLMILPSFACTNTGEHEHRTVRRVGITPTCQKVGKLEHWECVVCDKLYADAACTQEITKAQISLPKADHVLTHTAAIPATETEHGNIEYWTCDVCDGYFADAQGKSEITQADTVAASLVSLVDFSITIPDDRDPVILQLGDPQIIDADQMRAGGTLSQEQQEMWAWDEDILENRCYKYIRETVEETNPDLILVTGDIIYGSYDDNGRVLESFVDFMETLGVKWAPIMGNHDVESAKGADWQCQQYEEANNCFFKQGDIMGNGNYTIGIMQGGELRRVIVNMDTNGCTGASQASKNNGHTVHHGNNSYGKPFGTYGLQKDQVAWLNDTVKGIQKFVPDVKLSFHLHIPMNAAAEAFNNAYKDLTGNNPVASVLYASGSGKFGGTDVTRVLYPERVVGHREGDIGALYWLWQGDPVPDFWDTAGVHGTVDNTVFNQIKALGTDSFFFGHMHSNSASIVYDGIRFQYGQKCSTYDTTQFITSNGSISYGNIYYDAGGNCTSGTPLVGGTVNPMDKDTGELKNPYIYYCTGAGKEIDWASYKRASAA